MKSLMETFVGSLRAIVLFAYCADLALGAGSASLQQQHDVIFQCVLILFPSVQVSYDP